MLPLLYARCALPTLAALAKFTAHLYASDQRWDSIRRIPYSTPGRWVQSLDLSQIHLGPRDECAADALLTRLLPLLPFLAHLELSVGIQLSRRVMAVLGSRDGACNLRVLKGVKYDARLVGISPSHTSARPCMEDDPLTLMVAGCLGLEELEVIGVGLDDLDLPQPVMDDTDLPPTPPSTPPPPSATLLLPHLHTLTLLSTPASALLHHLVHARLPALRSAVLTPYGDLAPPRALVAAFLAAHGPRLRTLVLHTPHSWPTTLRAPPRALLRLAPNLTALSLEMAPLELDAPADDNMDNYTPAFSLSAHSPTSRGRRLGHPLTSLWIPRPSSHFRDALLPLLPHLPALREIRARDVRWAKRGMSERALEAGHQGEMRTWRRLLATRRIKMLDADGREGD